MNGDFFESINKEHIVRRSRISKKFNNEMLFNKILYVLAPIGGGKTVAVIDYANDYLENKVWHEISEEDNEPRNFLISLIKIIGDIGKDVNVKKYYNMVNNVNFNDKINTILNMLCSHLEDDGIKKVIIIDNLQIITNETIFNILVDFISLSPKNYKFIFLSRKKVPAYFSDFVVKREIQLIDSKDLTFNEEDIKEFYFKEGINFDDIDIRDILINTKGWPAAMSAILMCLKLNDYGRLNNSRNLVELFKNNEYINNFFTKNVWDKWDYRTKNFFMKISLFEELKLDECIEITDVKDSREILEEFLKIKEDETFDFNPMFLDFLKEKSKELKLEEKREVYKRAATYFERKGLNLEAAKYYSNAGNLEGEIRSIEKFCTNGIMFTKLNTIEKYVRSISKEIMVQNPTLCSLMAILEYINYRLEESEKWYKILLNIKKEESSKMIKNQEILDDINGKIFYISVILGKISDEEIKDQFYEMYVKGKNNEKIIQNISLTFNFPSILRNIKDTYFLWKDWIKFDKGITNILSKVYGEYGIGMAEIAYSEINYEKNELNLSLIELTNVITKSIEYGHVDNIFVAYIIFEKVMCANGYVREAKAALEKIGNIIEDKKALHLMKNLNAVYARFNLLNGDNGRAKEWFNTYFNSREKNFNILDTYEYMTQARLHIAYGEYKMANSLLQIMYNLNFNYKYTSTLIECCILQSISLYRDGDENLALKKIEEALKMAEPFEYIRIFADEGEAVHDVLNKYLKSDKLDENINLKYIKKILVEARKFGRFHPKYLKLEKLVNNIKLTKSELQILNLIYKGMSNIEISEYLSIKKDTVKFHVRNIYSKLNVKNRMQAVQAADKIGIINEKRLM